MQVIKEDVQEEKKPQVDMHFKKQPPQEKSPYTPKPDLPRQTDVVKNA